MLCGVIGLVARARVPACVASVKARAIVMGLFVCAMVVFKSIVSKPILSAFVVWLGRLRPASIIIGILGKAARSVLSLY